MLGPMHLLLLFNCESCHTAFCSAGDHHDLASASLRYKSTEFPSTRKSQSRPCAVVTTDKQSTSLFGTPASHALLVSTEEPGGGSLKGHGSVRKYEVRYDAEWPLANRSAEPSAESSVGVQLRSCFMAFLFPCTTRLHRCQRRTAWHEHDTSTAQARSGNGALGHWGTTAYLVHRTSERVERVKCRNVQVSGCRIKAHKACDWLPRSRADYGRVLAIPRDRGKYPSIDSCSPLLPTCLHLAVGVLVRVHY